MKVVVAGANGLTGRIVLRMLAEAGHQPVAMIRDFAQREELELLGAECRIGDLEKPVGYAVRDCRGAIFAAGSGSKTGPEKTIDVDQNGAMAFTETCVRFNARRFVMLSSIAVDEPERGPESLHHYFRAKAIADHHLQASGLNYTIVRPGFLTNEPGTGAIATGDDLGPDRQGDPLGDPRGRGAGAGGLPQPRQHHREDLRDNRRRDAHRRRAQGALSAHPLRVSVRISDRSAVRATLADGSDCSGEERLGHELPCVDVGAADDDRGALAP